MSSHLKKQFLKYVQFTLPKFEQAYPNKLSDLGNQFKSDGIDVIFHANLRKNCPNQNHGYVSLQECTRKTSHDLKIKKSLEKSI